MHRFRVRDLMINVLPESEALRAAQSCLEACISCGGCSLEPCTYGPTRGCDFLCTNYAPRSFSPYLAPEEQLAMAKQQLRQALAQVEAQERVQSEAMRPQTLEEATALEEKLEEALEEVRERKEELQEGAED